MPKTHHYEVSVTWTGNSGTGTSSYRAFERAHEVEAKGKPPIVGSSDPSFRGDAGRWNPEELLVASVSQCHMLWFLHLCSTKGIVVTAYTDSPYGTMVETPDGGGRFEEVILRPRAVLDDPTKADEAAGLHEQAHNLCFIANSVNFTVRHEPTFG
ncbi:OsmC family protein [Actinomadura rubrisoli]|uniref:OsmC family peroxiredoxin n=1 Tax=Actinomadura rubrisoli TaxID=2530368 RepID=A0A4R5AG59_9ACTN|nr:OsmC family protein [Actinomadura rubrisoli]TDD70605.1 OsmC family peroxiredoxin [Actinomadura rubrisoli]